MTDVDAVLNELRSLVGEGGAPPWPTREFGAPVPGVPDWTGDPSGQAHDASRRLDAMRVDLIAVYASAGPLVQKAAEVATFAQRSMDAVIAQWQADKAALAPYMGTGRGRAAYIELGRQRIGDASQILANAEQGFAALARQLDTAAGRLQARPGGPQSPHPVSDIPGWGTDTSEVKKWWALLSKDQQDALLRDAPEAIGQLDGLPSAVRDQANRAVMTADLDRIDRAAAEHFVSTDWVRRHPQDFGLTTTDIVRYDNAARTRAALADQNRTTGAPTMLLIYKPEAFDGQGRAALAINNPDQADNVAVVVPGTSHSVAGGWLGAADSANLYNQMQASGDGSKNAVIAWMGYDAPDSLTDGRIASTNLAHVGAGLLVNDVNGFRDAAQGDPHYTIIGHSYGSTTVADAAWIGTKTNDVVLIGSPGTDMAGNAKDFNLPAGGNVYVGSASTDPITQLGKLPAIPLPGMSATIGLGPDPAADDFGAIRFKAEVPGVTLNDHSHYYQPGTESLRSIGLIATAQGPSLHSLGLTAPARDDLLDQVIKTGVFGPLGAISDMELPRLPFRTDR